MNIQTLKEASDCLLNLAKPETQTIEHILLQDAFEPVSYTHLALPTIA